jgi:DNA-binding NtrC family response regulator
LLVDHFVNRFNKELGKFVREVSPDVLDVLRQHLWPGNIRELENVLRHALIHAPGDTLTLNLLPPDLAGKPGEAAAVSTFDLAQYVRDLLQRGESDVYRRVCLEVDRVVLELTLEHTRGNQMSASELLGISRNTLRTKLRALGLVLQKQLLSDSEQDDQTLLAEASDAPPPEA